jgi:hypothetical protein
VEWSCGPGRVFVQFRSKTTTSMKPIHSQNAHAYVFGCPRDLVNGRQDLGRVMHTENVGHANPQ